MTQYAANKNAVQRLFLSFQLVGPIVTLKKVFVFAQNYFPKTPFERMILLKYRHQVDPMELAESSLNIPDCQTEIDFSGMDPDIRAVAFFDPAAEAFSGDSGALEKLSFAAASAAKHGLHGFCFYWRDPRDSYLLNLLLLHPEIPLNFCVCRVSDQTSEPETEHDSFFSALPSFMSDPRYLRVEGKPLLLSLNTNTVQENRDAFAAWRRNAQACGVGELQIWACRTSSNPKHSESAASGADAEVEFPPLDIPAKLRLLKDSPARKQRGNCYSYAKTSTFRKVITYKLMTEDGERPPEALPLHRTCAMTWNKPPFKISGHRAFSKFSPHQFYNWIVTDAAYTRWRFPQGQRILFVSGWNGDAADARLSPNAKEGYAYLNTLSKALFGLPFYDDFRVITEQSAASLQFDDSGSTPRICAQVHLFFLETMDELIDELNRIPFRFDCFVSTDTGEKKAQIERAFAERSRAEHVSVDCFLNRGRDIAPFLLQMKSIIDHYDYILHVHGKKSTIKELGYAWREYLLRNLLGHTDYVRGVIAAFERDDRLGIVFPETFPILNLEPVRRNERVVCERLLKRCGFTAYRFNAPTYPAGDMFWARTKAIRRLFKIGISVQEFSKETGKPTQMLAHHIERLWVDLAANEGYGYLKTWNCCGRTLPVAAKRRIAFYVHYDKDCVLSETDAVYIDELSKYVEQLIFITNSDLSEAELEKIHSRKATILKRTNIGYDFGAWKDAVTEYGFDRLGEFDQVIFANNSNFAPLWSLSSVFAEMERRKPVDFWGIIEHQRGYAISDMAKTYIDAHLQSYFFVAEQSLASSPVFAEFWSRVSYHTAIIDVIEHEETEMTKFFADKGFTYDAFISESALIMEKTKNNAPYMSPRALVLLNNPFVKKKSGYFTFPDEKIMLEETMRQIKAASMTER